MKYHMPYLSKFFNLLFLIPLKRWDFSIHDVYWAVQHNASYALFSSWKVLRNPHPGKPSISCVPQTVEFLESRVQMSCSKWCITSCLLVVLRVQKTAHEISVHLLWERLEYAHLWRYTIRSTESSVIWRPLIVSRVQKSLIQANIKLSISGAVCAFLTAYNPFNTICFSLCQLFERASFNRDFWVITFKTYGVCTFMVSNCGL